MRLGLLSSYRSAFSAWFNKLILPKLSCRLGNVGWFCLIMTKKCKNFCEYFPPVIPKVHVIERWLTILVTFYKWNELCLLSLFYSHSTHFYFCRWHKEKISYSNVGQACKNFAAEQDYLYRNKVRKEDSSWLNLFLFVKC